MTSSKRILMVLTSQSTMGNTDRQTGVWFEELTTPYYVFVDAGYDVVLASPAGGMIPVDPHSRDVEVQSVKRFLADGEAVSMLENSTALEDVVAGSFAAIFLPGGHGTMYDLPANANLAKLLSDAWRNQKVVAAVCHGPAGLLAACDENGDALVTGRKISAFSNAEEEAAGLTQVMPFLLETRIRELGGVYQCAPVFEPHAVRDGRLVTGQNPMSSELVANLTIQAMSELV